MTANQNPEQQARDRIDAQLRAAGWAVQKKIDFSAGAGQAVREWQTDVGPADYVLFVDKKAVGVICTGNPIHNTSTVAISGQGTSSQLAGMTAWRNFTRSSCLSRPRPRMSRGLFL